MKSRFIICTLAELSLVGGGRPHDEGSHIIIPHHDEWESRYAAERFLFDKLESLPMNVGDKYIIVEVYSKD